MGITLTCYDPVTGQMSTFEADTVGAGGAGYGQSTISNQNAFGAKRVIMCLQDAFLSIEEGRQSGNLPFSIYNSASPWDSAQ